MRNEQSTGLSDVEIGQKKCSSGGLSGIANIAIRITVVGDPHNLRAAMLGPNLKTFHFGAFCIAGS